MAEAEAEHPRVDPMPGDPPGPSALVRNATRALSLGLGVLSAFAWMALSAPYFDGRARSTFGVGAIVLAVAVGVIVATLHLTRQWSPRRLIAHFVVAALGFGLFFLGLFVMITSFQPACPDTADAASFAGILGEAGARPWSCPG